MVWRLVWGAIRLLVALAIIVVIAGAWLFWRAMPVYSGAERLPGLSAEVRVWRDGYGVPHIFAASMDDAARALGYLHASERLFQMELQRRVGQGRLAEVFGPDRLGVDKFIRTLGFYREAESSFAALAPWAQKRLQAYADGVNAFLDTHKNALPPEFLIVGDTPEPWKPADSLVWGKLMALQLSANYRLEALRAHLIAKARRRSRRVAVSGREAGRSDHHRCRRSMPTHVARRRHRGRDRRTDRDRPRRLERMGRLRVPHQSPASRSSPTIRTSGSRRRFSGIWRGLSRRDCRSRARRRPERRSSCSARTTGSPGASPPPIPTRRTCSSRRSIRPTPRNT